MSVQTRPLDFVAIKKALVGAVQTATGTTCIKEEKPGQDNPRPDLPYFSYKITTPAAKNGDDALGNEGGSKWSRGGQRKMSVSFHCYAAEQDEAYSLMGLWQSSLEMNSVQEFLRKSGIAVWTIGSVVDLSQLLNTGYEARSNMEVQFGIAANLVEDLSYIETVRGTGTVKTDQGDVGSTLDVTS